MRVSVELLESLGANCEGLEDFKRVFPRGANITLRNCLKAGRANLDIDWFAPHFLSTPAKGAYYKATVIARGAYYKATVIAREAYYKAIAIAFFEAYKESQKIKRRR